MEQDLRQAEISLLDARYAALKPGAILNKRYEVLGKLGRGASAVVYRCIDRTLGNLNVALKVFPASILDCSAHGQRLERELRASFAIDHENVARYYELVRNPEVIAIVMEYVEGETLSDFIAKKQGLRLDQIFHYLRQLCSGVQAIHDLGLVHRDLKPANVLISQFGSIKITDLGLARGLDQLDEKQVTELCERDGLMNFFAHRITYIGDMVGTPYYMPPEYLRSGSFDARSDLYALGMIAFELISHEPPFEAESLQEFIELKMHKGPPKLHEMFPDFPEELSLAISKAMEPDPDRRFQSVEEFSLALERARHKLRPKEHERPTVTRSSNPVRSNRSAWGRFLAPKFLLQLLIATLIVSALMFKYIRPLLLTRERGWANPGFTQRIGGAAQSNQPARSGYRVITGTNKR